MRHLIEDPVPWEVERLLGTGWFLRGEGTRPAVHLIRPSCYDPAGPGRCPAGSNVLTGGTVVRTEGPSSRFTSRRLAKDGRVAPAAYASRHIRQAWRAPWCTEPGRDLEAAQGIPSENLGETLKHLEGSRVTIVLTNGAGPYLAGGRHLQTGIIRRCIHA